MHDHCGKVKRCLRACEIIVVDRYGFIVHQQEKQVGSWGSRDAIHYGKSNWGFSYIIYMVSSKTLLEVELCNLEQHKCLL